MTNIITISAEEVRERFEVCDVDGCQNSYTPNLDTETGARYCLTHDPRRDAEDEITFKGEEIERLYDILTFAYDVEARRQAEDVMEASFDLVTAEKLLGRIESEMDR